MGEKRRNLTTQHGQQKLGEWIDGWGWWTLSSSLLGKALRAAEESMECKIELFLLN